MVNIYSLLQLVKTCDISGGPSYQSILRGYQPSTVPYIKQINNKFTFRLIFLCTGDNRYRNIDINIPDVWSSLQKKFNLKYILEKSYAQYIDCPKNT